MNPTNVKAALARVVAVVGAVAAVATGAAGCTGRDVSVAKNDNATITPTPPPPPPPPPQVRKLSHDRKLFGTMPVENRFEDPLITFTGVGWQAFSNDFQSYANITRSVSDSPTKTAFVAIPHDGNPQGATLLGELKTARTPLHVEVWLGRDGEDGVFNHAEADLAGLMADGSGELVTSLVGDETTKTVIDGKTWEKFTLDMPEGPLGWTYLLVADTSSPVNSETLYVGGPVGVDVPASTGGAFIAPHMRALTAHERALIDAAQEKTRQLAAAAAQPHDGPTLPGVAPSLH